MVNIMARRPVPALIGARPARRLVAGGTLHPVGEDLAGDRAGPSRPANPAARAGAVTARAGGALASRSRT